MNTQVRYILLIVLMSTGNLQAQNKANQAFEQVKAFYKSVNSFEGSYKLSYVITSYYRDPEMEAVKSSITIASNGIKSYIKTDHGETFQDAVHCAAIIQNKKTIYLGKSQLELGAEREKQIGLFREAFFKGAEVSQYKTLDHGMVQLDVTLSAELSELLPYHKLRFHLEPATGKVKKSIVYYDDQYAVKKAEISFNTLIKNYAEEPFKGSITSLFLESNGQLKSLWKQKGFQLINLQNIASK